MNHGQSHFSHHVFHHHQQEMVHHHAYATRTQCSTSHFRNNHYRNQSSTFRTRRSQNNHFRPENSNANREHDPPNIKIFLGDHQENVNGTRVYEEKIIQKNSKQSQASETTKIEEVEDVNRNASTTNLIVNYLPQSMNDEQLQNLFKCFGELENCKVIIDKDFARSLGYGFVKFVDSEDAQKALDTINGLLIENKVIKVSFARPSSNSIIDTNLYITGFPQTMTEENLTEMFRPFGCIITLRLLYETANVRLYLKDKKTPPGPSLGTAFVRFDNHNNAKNAVKALNQTVPKGCFNPITVKFAKPRKPPKNTHPLTNVPYTITDFAYNENGNAVLPRVAYTGWVIFIYNLPFDCTEHNLWELFGPFGAVQEVKVMRNSETNKCRGYGFVTMRNYYEAEIAVKFLNGHTFCNRILQVSFKTSAL